MNIIKKNDIKSSVESISKSINMLDNVNMMLKEKKSNYNYRLDSIKLTINNAIYKYSTYILTLRNSIIYVEVEDENGIKHLESPNVDSVYEQIEIYEKKIQKCNNILAQYNSVYKEYYNNIEREVDIVSNKIKAANKYLYSLAVAQKEYLGVEIKKANNNNSTLENNIFNSNKNSDGTFDNSNLVSLLIEESDSTSLKNKRDYAYEQMRKFEKVGGGYTELRKLVKKRKLGYLLEVHHMPPRSVAQILEAKNNIKSKEFEAKEDISPAIIIFKVDHEKTASFGSSKKSIEFQKKQKELILGGRYVEAFENEKNDIRSNFGDKYDKQLREVEDYITTLYFNDKINLEE